MTRSTRLLALLQSLRGRRTPITAAQLATEFGISERTIYRDIAALVEQGARIEGASGLGYMLRPGFFLPPLMVDRDEADAIMLGLRFVAQRGDGDLATAAESAMAKVAEVLPEDAEAGARMNGLVVAPSSRQNDPLMAGLRNALDTEHKLRLSYCDRKARATERVIWPVALGFFEEAEVLAAWCELRSDFRHFRLDRIVNFDALEERLPTPRRILFAEWRLAENGIET